MDYVVTILVALFTGGALKAFFDYLIQKQKFKYRRNKNQFERLFKDIHEVYRILNNIKNNTQAERVLIVRVDDTGGIPDVNTPLHSTALYEVFHYPLSSLKSSWQKVRVGEVYVRIMQGLYEEKKIAYLVEDLEESELKDLHIEKNTKYIENYFIKSENRYFLYLSLEFSEDCSQYETSVVYRNSIRINTQNLIEIFEGDSNVEF